MELSRIYQAIKSAYLELSNKNIEVLEKQTLLEVYLLKLKVLKNTNSYKYIVKSKGNKKIRGFVTYHPPIFRQSLIFSFRGMFTSAVEIGRYFFK